MSTTVDDPCGMCYDPLTRAWTAHIHPCNHRYHIYCLATWRLTTPLATCPNCRGPLRIRAEKGTIAEALISMFEIDVTEENLNGMRKMAEALATKRVNRDDEEEDENEETEEEEVIIANSAPTTNGRDSPQLSPPLSPRDYRPYDSRPLSPYSSIPFNSSTAASSHEPPTSPPSRASSPPFNHHRHVHQSERRHYSHPPRYVSDSGNSDSVYRRPFAPSYRPTTPPYGGGGAGGGSNGGSNRRQRSEHGRHRYENEKRWDPRMHGPPGGSQGFPGGMSPVDDGFERRGGYSEHHSHRGYPVNPPQDHRRFDEREYDHGHYRYNDRAERSRERHAEYLRSQGRYH